jgi:hypothetical protein
MTPFQMIRRAQFEFTGLHRAECPQSLTRFLQMQRARIRNGLGKPRPWHYVELHNPWSRAAASFDSWGFLDLCHSTPLVEEITAMIGPDVILYNSQWLPDPWRSIAPEADLESDAHRCPVEPLHGVTVLIYCADPLENATQFKYAPGSHQRVADLPEEAQLLLEPGDVLIVDSNLKYCVCHAKEPATPVTYAIHYFPATSRYVRDPNAPVHRALTERYPLLNYAKLPLWLIHGTDRANNDFVTGFNVRAPYWTEASW